MATRRQIDKKVKELNVALDLPADYMTDGKCNIGYIAVNYLQGQGYTLEQTSNGRGGVNQTVLGRVWFDRVSAKAMSAYLDGVLNGMRIRK